MPTVAAATTNAADDRPTPAISAVHSGVNNRPPMLAPLKAVLIAFGRSASNHGATMALSAAPLMAAHPAPLSSSAGTSCQACCALAQAMAPKQAWQLVPALLLSGAGWAAMSGAAH